MILSEETKDISKKINREKKKKKTNRDFPGGPVVKNPPVNTGDRGSIRGLVRSQTPRSS